MKKEKINKILFIGGLLLIGVIFYNVFLNVYETSKDIIDHNNFVVDLLNGESLNFAHLGYHYLVSLIHLISDATLKYSAIILLVLSMIIEYVFFYKSFSKVTTNKAQAILFSLILITLNSIYNPFISKISNGQFGSGMFHNPTYLIMRMLGMISAITFINIYNNKDSKIEYKKIIILSLVFAYSTYVKPNFSLVYFFTLFLVFVKDVIKKDWDRVKKIIVVTVPTALTLIVLYVLTFNSGESSSIIIEPFTVWRSFTGRTRFIFTTLLFTYAFPLVITMFEFKRDKKISFELGYGWICAFAGIILMMFFAESGHRMAHANFAWSLASANYFLFYYALYDFIKMRLKGVQNGFVWIILGLHIVSGIYYIIYLMQGNIAWAM